MAGEPILYGLGGTPLAAFSFLRLLAYGKTTKTVALRACGKSGFSIQIGVYRTGHADDKTPISIADLLLIKEEFSQWLRNSLVTMTMMPVVATTSVMPPTVEPENMSEKSVISSGIVGKSV